MNHYDLAQALARQRLEILYRHTGRTPEPQMLQATEREIAAIVEAAVERATSTLRAELAQLRAEMHHELTRMRNRPIDTLERLLSEPLEPPRAAAPTVPLGQPGPAYTGETIKRRQVPITEPLPPDAPEAARQDPSFGRWWLERKVTRDEDDAA